MLWEVLARTLDGDLVVEASGDTETSSPGAAAEAAWVAPDRVYLGVVLEGNRRVVVTPGWVDEHRAAGVLAEEWQQLRGEALRRDVRGVMRGLEVGESRAVWEIGRELGLRAGDVRASVAAEVGDGFADPVRRGRVSRPPWVLPE